MMTSRLQTNNLKRSRWLEEVEMARHWTIHGHFPSQPTTGIQRDLQDSSERGADEGQAKIINIGIIGYGYWGPNLLRNFV